MALPGSTTDFRKASEAELLDALRGGQPLALAEAYHRAVPAAHAVARRLLSGAQEVEEVLLEVFTRLWSEPPASPPLEGWARRTTWTVGSDRLRSSNATPASPSAASLLPDLPPPDVRFLDAAERAIADLADDERRALLLAHDKGVPSAGQEPGAEDALARALLALAGPETSSTDRTALHEDGCVDLAALGDWCLGIADPAADAGILEALEQRAGCAAKSRALRRGRRRIEGLPATPDMGQRILVTVLAGGGRAMAPVTTAAPATSDIVVTTAAGRAAVSSMPGESAEAAQADALDAQDAGTEMAAAADMPASGAPIMDIAESMEADSLLDTADLAQAVEGTAAAEMLEDADREAEHEADIDDVLDGDLDPMAPPEDSDWAPKPGDTAELRLSDILADEHEDDPFAALEQEQEDESADASRPNPYAALQGLGDEAIPVAAPGHDSVFAPSSEPSPRLVPDAENLHGAYVEGQEDHADATLVDDYVPARRGGAGAILLSWVLPILGGLLIGALLAIQVFGAPGGSS